MRFGMSRGRFVFGVALLYVTFAVTQADAGCTPGSGTVTCTGGAGSHISFEYTGDYSVIATVAAQTGFGTTISVTGGGSAVQSVSITLHGYTSRSDLSGDPNTSATASGDIGLLLVSPSGRNMEILRRVGDPGTAQNNMTVTLADGGSAIPSNLSGNAWTASGTYAPASWFNSPTPGATADDEPDYASAGAPARLHSAADNGTSTLNSVNGVFTGDTVNGNWKLYLVSDSYIGSDVQFSSWDITITFTAATTPTTTTLSPGPTTAFTSGSGSAVTLTATVASGSGTPTGTVTFKDGSTNLTCSGGNPAALSSGEATCGTTLSAEGYHSLSASYSGDSTFIASSGTAGVFTYNHATATGTTYCNSGAILATTLADTTPYPSVIYVGDGTGNSPSIPSNSASTISVRLNGFSAPVDVNGLHMMVVSPDGHAFDFWGEGGGGSASSGTYIIQDGGATVPNAPVSPGTYAPVSNFASDSFSLGTPFPAPTPQPPGGFSLAPPSGSASFQTSMVGAHTNGTWQLYVDNESAGHAPATAMSMTGGWCLDITAANGFATDVSLSSNPTQYATRGASTTFTATVTSSGHPTVNEGTVTFTENGIALTGAPNGGVASVVNGVATIATSSLPEGDHTITATYSDGGGTFNDSFGTETMRVDATTSTPTLNGSTWSYCNGSGITIPRGTQFVDDTGPATPNPSNVFVTNLPGTIQTASLTINGFSVTFPGDLESLLVGPNGKSLDFFSLVGGTVNTNFSQTMNFADAFSQVPTNGPVPANAAPTSAGITSYSTSPFYLLPAVQHAAPQGTFTFANVYGNSNGNGTWSLYFDQTIHHVGDGGASWCVNLLENPITVTATKAHAGSAPGNHFVQGEQNAQFTVAVHNSGPGSTGDPDSNHPLTVTDTLNAAFSYASGSGTGWSCSAVAQTVTCKNHNAIAQDADYPTLTINVNVAANATPGAVNNSAGVSGGGITATSTNTDTVTIDAAPDVTVTAGHTGTFTQGQTGQIDITSHNISSGSTTSGTTTVVDSLPAGWTLSSYTSAGNAWTCGAVTNTVTCTDTEAVAGAGDYAVLHLTVNVPANSAVSATNSVTISGGGEPAGATGNDTSSDSLTVVQVPTTVAVAGGGTQNTTVNTAFGTPLLVTVTDAGGVVVSGVTVTFTPNPAGNGASASLSSPATTNGSGQTSVTATANSKAGGYTVTASVSGGTTSGTFSLTNNAGTAAGVAVFSGNNQSTTTSTAFANPLVVTVTDNNGNPVSGVTVTFTPPATGASAGLTSPATTDSNGRTSVTATANATAGGPYTVTASVSGGSTTASFSLTNASSTAAITLDTIPTGLQVSDDGGTTFFAAPHTFQLAIGSNHTIVTTSPQSGGTGVQYVFSNWSDAGAITHSITVPSTATTYAATFTTRYQLTVNVSPVGGGTATPASGTFYDAGTVVNIGATANGGYTFSSWTGSAASPSSAATTVTMTGPLAVTANFTNGATSLGGSLGVKSGPINARVWPIAIGNNGPGNALGAAVTSFILQQTMGGACTPLVSTPMPLFFGDIGPHATATSNVVIDFSSCSAPVMFKLTATLSANSGTTTGTITKLNQLP